VACFCLVLYGVVYPEQFENLPGKIKIGFFSKSLAAEEATSSAATDKKEENKSTAETGHQATGAAAEAPAVSENQSHVAQLMEKEKELAEREKHIVELEEKLQQQKLELDEKIKQLDQARRDIASKLETRVAQDQENIEKLVGVYSNMKPQSAALVISKLDEELAISVLRKMKKQDAGAIMNYMDPQKTKVLSEKYSGY
jgi:flagellar motility protein MotE (MotC chaperone)